MSLRDIVDEGGFHPRSLAGVGASHDASEPGSLGLAVGGSLRAPAATGSSLRNSPYARTPTVRTPGGTITHKTEHGEFLSDKLEYLVPPQLTPVERETPVNARAVFMGHMKFETTSAEVRWLIRKLTGVTALKAEPRAKGCFLVHLATEADEAAVRGLHRRMLMDHSGVWVARNAQEAQTLSDYVEFVLSRGPKNSQKRLRLPKDCVTVETPHQQTPPPPTGHGVMASPPRTPTGVAAGFDAAYGQPPSQPSHAVYAFAQPAPPPMYGMGSPTTFGRGSRPPAFATEAPHYAPAPPPPPYGAQMAGSPVAPPPYRGPF